jgi:hypothetical protein
MVTYKHRRKLSTAFGGLRRTQNQPKYKVRMFTRLIRPTFDRYATALINKRSVCRTKHNLLYPSNVCGTQMEPSMSRNGNCWEGLPLGHNSPTGRFCSSGAVRDLREAVNDYLWKMAA